MSTDTLGPTGSIEESVPAGPTGSTEQIAMTLESMTGGIAAPPRVLLSDLLADVSILQQQEATDREKCLAISAPNLSDIRTKLTAWLAGGCQGSCDLIRIYVSAPNVCSDGIARNFFDYVQFVSDKTIAEHLASIQDILPDFEVGYRCSRSELVFCVVRIKA